MNHTIHISPQPYARIAGIGYLIIILLGVLGQIFIRGSLLVPADAATTVNNLTIHASLWRAGIFVDILMHMVDIPVMVIIYLLLKPLNRNIALVALAFNLIQTATLVVNKLTLILPMMILGSAGYMEVFAEQQIHAQIMLLIDLHNHGFALGLLFFGLACLLYGYLIFRSGYFPKFIGALIAIAGISYLTHGFTLILAPAVSAYTLPMLGLCLVGELSFCLWLIFKGVDLQEWCKKFSITNS